MSERGDYVNFEAPEVPTASSLPVVRAPSRENALHKAIEVLLRTLWRGRQEGRMSSMAAKISEEDRLWRLIRKARSGDKQAVDQLLSDVEMRRKAKVLGICLKRDNVRDDDRTSDALGQGILLTLRLRIATFNGNSKQEFGRWLRGLARSHRFDDLGRAVSERGVIEQDRLEGDKHDARESRRMIIEIWWDELDNELQIIVANHIAQEPLSESEGNLTTRETRSSQRRRLKRAQKQLVERIKGNNRG